MKKAKKTRVIPGYHLTFGIVITLLSLIVLIPLASVLVYALKLSPGEWFRLIMKENVRNAFLTSVGCSFLAAVINTVFGLILAWTLVKYEFPGKKLLDGFIELPFALPTAVAGITLSKLFTDSGFYGKIFAKLGIRIAYTKAGLVIALIFVGIPFVVRAVQPVLEKMDGQYEEAAFMLAQWDHYAYDKYSYVFNTIPAMVLDAGHLQWFSPSILIYDIASSPGGTDFAYCKAHGIRADIYLGIPGKLYPKEAGTVIASGIYEHALVTETPSD